MSLGNLDYWPIVIAAVAALMPLRQTHGAIIGRKAGAGRKNLSAQGLGNLFLAWAIEAGIDGRLHGLRHWTATELGNRGATQHEIMSVTGHKSPAEVARFQNTPAANGTSAPTRVTL